MNPVYLLEGVNIDFTPITSALTSAFTVSQLMAIIGIIVGSGTAFMVVWFGARKLTSAIQHAFEKGRLKF